MVCPICQSDHLPGQRHSFSYINKIVTRPTCPQCDARDKVIDDLYAQIERLKSSLVQSVEPQEKPKFDHREHMKQVWAKRKSQIERW